MFCVGFQSLLQAQQWPDRRGARLLAGHPAHWMQEQVEDNTLCLVQGYLKQVQRNNTLRISLPQKKNPFLCFFLFLIKYEVNCSYV